MAETLPVTDAKAHLSDLVDRVLREHERFVMTRNGRPAAVLVNPDDLEFLLEDLVDDPELSAPGRPKAFELAPEGFAGAYRIVRDRSEDGLENRSSDLFK